MAKTKKRLQLNVDFNSAPELLREVEGLAQKETEGNVSLFVRKVLRQEIARRQQLELPIVVGKAQGMKVRNVKRQPVVA